jgi:hypothetical protein
LKRDAVKHAADCVRVNLWEDHGDHWRVHDYDSWYSNDADAKISKDKKLAALRAKRYRDGHRDDSAAVTHASRDVTRDATVTHHAPSRDVTRDIPSRGPARVPNSYSDTDSCETKSADPSPRVTADQPRCPTVEHPNRLDPDEILNVLNKSSGGVIEMRGTGPVQKRFFDGIHEAKWTLAEMENLGRFIAAGGAAWANRKRFDLGWFLFNDTRLGELVTKASEWAEQHPKVPPIAPPVLVRIGKLGVPVLTHAELAEQSRATLSALRGHRG